MFVRLLFIQMDLSTDLSQKGWYVDYLESDGQTSVLNRLCDVLLTLAYQSTRRTWAGVSYFVAKHKDKLTKNCSKT